MNRPRFEMSSRVEQILDLLLDALLERQQTRAGQPPAPRVEPQVPRLAAVERPPEPEPVVEPEPLLAETTAEATSTAEPAPPPPEPEVEPEALLEESEVENHVADEAPLPVPSPTNQTGRMLFRLIVGLFFLIALVNVPINREGYGLAQTLPGGAALIIRDGLLVKGENRDGVYVLENNKLRLISSMEAFERRGYRWQDVRIVQESFLEKFEKGWPVHVLLKCGASPHIYALESGKKRWIKDILTFEAQGYVWEDVKPVGCNYLRNLPDGPSIPEDAGPPPQP
jgi:hypothetical protein